MALHSHFCHSTNKLHVPGVLKVFSSPNVFSLWLLDVFLKYSSPPLFYAWITPTCPQVSNYILFSPMILPLIPLNFHKTVLDHLLCASITPYIQSIITINTVHFHYLSLFPRRCRFLKTGPALFTTVSPLTNRAWSIADTQNQFAKLMKEMNWHTRTTLLCSTKQRAWILFSTFTVTKTTLEKCFSSHTCLHQLFLRLLR